MLRRYLDTLDNRVPLTGGKYLLTLSGVFKLTNSDTIIPFDYTELGEPIANVDFGYGEIKMKVAVLLAIKHKAIKIPHPYWKHLDVLYIDGNPANFHPSNTVWKFPKDGIKSNIDSEFRYIPGFSRYQINEQGIVYSKSTNKFISPYKDQMGYSMYGVTPDVGNRTIVGMHRLLALAFLIYPSNVDILDVNHLDGIKHNNALSNLEWARRKRNCDHAYSTGLRSDNVITLVKNVFSEEVKEFYSIEECARKLKLDSENIRLRLKADDGKVYYPGFQFKTKNSTTPWVKVEDIFRDIRKNSLRIPLLVENLISGEIKEHPDQESVGKQLGISAGAVGFHLKNNVREKIVRNFRIFYPDFEQLSLSSFAEM